MPELALYRNPEIQYAPRINLQVADKALTTMEQNHLKTIELEGELASAVNAMDLDESENEYKAGLINEIKQSVDNSTIDGYSGYALSDIVRKYGDIKGNPVLRGKVLANAAHKANDKLLDELAIKGTISSDTAAYFKAKNPYYNNIKYDKDGNAIGTDTWKANINPVEDIDLNKLFSAAKQYISPKINSWNSVKFVHADGRVDSNFSEDVKFLQHSNGSKEVITKQQIRDAVDAAINANGAYRQGLEQLYKVQVWKGENKDYQPNELANGAVPALDEYGKPVGFDTFLNKLITPFQDALAKNNTASTVSYTPYATTKTSSGGKKGGSGSGDMVERILGSDDPKVVTTAPFNIDGWNTTLNLTHDALDKSRAYLQRFQDIGLGRTDLKMDDYATLPTPENLKAALTGRTGDNTLSKQEIDDYTKFYKLHEDSILSFDNTKRDEDDPKRYKEYALRAADMISFGQMNSSFANSDNEVYRKTSDIHNGVIERLYGNSDSFGFKPKDKAQAQFILNKLNGRPGVYEDNGIIYLNRDGQDNIEAFVDIISQNRINGEYYRKKDNGKDDRISSRSVIDLPRWFEVISGGNQNVRPSSNGTMERGYALRNHFSPSQIASIAKEPEKYLSSIYGNSISSSSDFERVNTTGTANLQGMTPTEIEGNILKFDINSDSDERAVAKLISDTAKEESIKAIVNPGSANYTMFTKKLDENGNAIFVPLYDQNEKEEILADLRSLSIKKRFDAVEGYLTDIPGVRELGTQLTWVGERLQPDPNDGNKKKPQPITREIFIQGNVSGDPEVEAMINSSKRQAANEVYATTVFNKRPTTVASYNGFNANIDYLGTQGDSVLFTLKTSNGTQNTINRAQANAYRHLYNSTINLIGGAADQIMNGLQQSSPGEDEELYQMTTGNQLGAIMLADILQKGELGDIGNIISLKTPTKGEVTTQEQYADFILDPDNYIVDGLNLTLTEYITNNIFN